MFPCEHEWGFWFAAHSRDDAAVSLVGQVGAMQQVVETFTPTDIYAFFYRYRAEDIGGEARGFAGWTGDSDGLIGADFRIPIAPRWDIDCAFTYLIPRRKLVGTRTRTRVVEPRDEHDLVSRVPHFL